MSRVVYEPNPGRYIVEVQRLDGQWQQEESFCDLVRSKERADYLARLFPAERVRVIDTEATE